MDVFPQEMVDAVIDCVSIDRKALVACSTVSSSWRTSSLRWLFKTIKVIYETRINHLQHFSQFLSVSPHAATCVVSLTLHCEDEPPGSVDTDLLVSILSTLPSLRSLSLDCLEIWNNHAIASPLEFPLQSLFLRRLILNGGCSLASLLKLFPYLKELSIHENCDGLIPEAEDAAHLHSFALYKLSLKSPSRPLVTFLRKYITSCTSLHLVNIQVDSHEELGKFINSFSSSLSDVSFLGPHEDIYSDGKTVKFKLFL